MNSNDDQSSLPAAKIRAPHRRRNAKLRISRAVVLTLLAAATLCVATPRSAAQTPSEPPAPAQSQSQPQQQAVAPARTIQLDDFTKISSVSDPQISPDGKSIAFVLSRVNLEQDRADRDLLIIDIASGAPRALTHDRKGVGSPRWSPEGDRLAFEAIDTAAKDPKLQLFVLPMQGGEAHRLTDREGAEVPMTPLEFELLKAFADHPNQALSRDRILNLSQQRNWDPFDRSVDLRIMRLRKKIEPDPEHPQYIKTVRNEGYVFVPGAE